MKATSSCSTPGGPTSRWGTFPDYFTRSPFLTPEAADWLALRRPSAVGFDFFEEYCARLEDFTSEDFICHRILLGAGIPLLEGIMNLGERRAPPLRLLRPLLQDRPLRRRPGPLLRVGLSRLPEPPPPSA